MVVRVGIYFHAAFHDFALTPHLDNAIFGA
jgi:hypothetical protein